ncbi:winged helix-turn-helix domain-containing protein [Streptomyces sp. DG2A-72]|uniref:helix-turn-helix domain-containing protein n=1 Tax=Streptomyces sp. DG2A-72 TaxID=3051386 RepID=UPI00346400B8
MCPDEGPTGRRPGRHGWTEDQRWTLARVATVIARRFHVRFSPAQTWRILRQMGFTVQAPVRRAAERDEEAVATWSKTSVAGRPSAGCQPGRSWARHRFPCSAGRPDLSFGFVLSRPCRSR